MPFFDYDRIQFHYELTGVGPTLAFCHGLTGDLEQSKQLIGPLPGYQRLVWDARGHGKTRPAGPAEGFTFGTLARDLAALLDHLHISEVVVGGLSMGAGVSVRFATRYPNRVRALVLVRPAWLEQPLPEGLRFHPLVAEYLGQFDSERACGLFQQSGEYRELREQSPDAAESLSNQFFVEDAVERRWRLVGIPNDAPIRIWKEAEDLEIPALVVGNESDPLHPFSYAVTWAEHLPYGRLVQVPPKSVDFCRHATAVRVHITAMLASLRRDSYEGTVS